MKFVLTLLAQSIMKQHHEVIIAGGGTGGLFAATKLKEKGVDDVVVLEARPFVGGRIQTTRDDNDSPMFNDFAWRISEVNTMMIDLCKELDIKLIPQFTPNDSSNESSCKQCKHGPLSSMDCDVIEEAAITPNRPPLSDFARASLRSAASGDCKDRESGYAGRSAQISWPDEDHGNDCWVVEGGMDRIPKTLAKKLPEGCVRTNIRVSEVEKTDSGYKVSAVKRDGNTYTDLEFTCSQLVLAAPPCALRSFQVSKDMMPALSAVHERRSAHAYAKCAEGTPNVPDQSEGPNRVYRKIEDSVLQQVISGDYGKGIFQAAYTSDRFERVWRELQYQGKEVVMKEVKEQLTKISNLESPPDGWDAIEEIFLRIGFVHRWHIEAHLTGKDKKALSLQAITPNTARLPGLYLIGEAFSPYQGWTEGALWTAEKAVNIIAASRTPSGEYKYSEEGLSKHALKMTLEEEQDGDETKVKVSSTPKIMTYKGLVMDVDDWYARHPGGAGPINGHSGEDISHIFDNFHPGWNAPLATLFGLQIGSTDR
jgi:monoamine oxidase